MKNQLKQPQTYTFMDFLKGEIKRLIKLNGCDNVDDHPDKVEFSCDDKRYRFECKEIKK